MTPRPILFLAKGTIPLIPVARGELFALGFGEPANGRRQWRRWPHSKPPSGKGRHHPRDRRAVTWWTWAPGGK